MSRKHCSNYTGSPLITSWYINSVVAKQPKLYQRIRSKLFETELKDHTFQVLCELQKVDLAYVIQVNFFLVQTVRKVPTVGDDE